MKSKIDTSSIERLVPDEVDKKDATGLDTLELHLERYEFACKHVSGGKVLDIACGAGYGTSLLAQNLAERIESVTGVDVSVDAVGYARSRYGGDTVEFLHGDAMSYGDGLFYDAIVSLETIEHLDNPGEFITRLKSMLRPGGVLVASVPVTPSVDFNPYHKMDFTENSFKKIFEDLGFGVLAEFKQTHHFNPFTLMNKKEKRSQDLRSGVLTFYLKRPSKLLLRLCSLFKDGFCNKYLTIAWTLK